MHNKEFFQSVPLGICAVDRTGDDFKILFVNDAFLQMINDNRFNTPSIGSPLATTWPSYAIHDLVEALSQKPVIRNFTLPVDDQDDGTRRWVKIAISEDRFEDQDCFILWVTDISDNKDNEVRLEQAVKEADALAHAKSNFLATMSHEIRTPMQTIYGFLELISEEKPEPGVQTMVDTAKRAASGLLEILDDILDFAKMDADEMELDHFEVPVRTLVRGTLEALAVKVHGKDVKITDDIDTDMPFVVSGDPKRLRQIIMNLTGNALKFTERGSVTVHVSRTPKAMPAPQTGLIMRFEIRDTGIGMNEEARSRLFKPFSQADNTTSRKYGGTGLGLSISKRLVELMGGQIGVESIPGKGSTFWFEIPTEEVSVESSSTADLPSLEGISILSVEDHPQGAREIMKSLQSMGAKVENCSTYKEALELVRRRPFDVGVIDQGLPDGLGIDLIRDIMNIRSSMGLIMYTVRDDMGLQHSLQTMGVTYLSKPASRLGLGTAIKDATRKQTRISADGTTRLLIAEDNDAVREVLRRQLEKLDVQADFVTNGREALEALGKLDYSILFTDLHMPEIDGYGLVKILRERETEQGPDADRLPIVVLTADVQMAQRQVYLAEGFDECLLKPVSLGQMRRLLMRWGLVRDGDIAPAAAAQESGLSSGGTAVNIEMLMEQMGMDRAGVIEIMGMFVEMTAPLIEQIEKNNQLKDFEALKEDAHSLKGSARSACCITLGNYASRLQDESESRKPDDKLVARLIAEFQAVKAEVEALSA